MMTEDRLMTSVENITCNRQFEALCSSSNTSSSSSKTTQPSESSCTPLTFVSSTFIPLKQSRPLLPQHHRDEQKREHIDTNHNLDSSSDSSDSYETKSVLSFSASNSISSISSSISYGDIEDIQSPPICISNSEKSKQDNGSLGTSEPSPGLLEIAAQLTEITAPYRGKEFYAKEWFFIKLSELFVERKCGENNEINQNLPSCLVLLGKF